MASATFDVESYTVRILHGGDGTSRRIIKLTSTALAHGIRTRASVHFYDDDPEPLGVVTNVDQLNFNGHSIYARCRRTDFAVWYDMLRNEAPLKLEYRYEGEEPDLDRPHRDLEYISLFTGLEEPPGEGSEDLFMDQMLAVLARSAPDAEGSDETTPATSQPVVGAAATAGPG